MGCLHHQFPEQPGNPNRLLKYIGTRMETLRPSTTNSRARFMFWVQADFWVGSSGQSLLSQNKFWLYTTTYLQNDPSDFIRDVLGL